mgnify:CR=1 FL=1
MNVYLSGPVTGRDYEDACAEFARAAARERLSWRHAAGTRCDGA